MEPWVCMQCGQHYDGNEPPAGCRVCEDVRQFVRWEGQAWTTMPALRDDHRIVWRDDAGLTGIAIDPAFAIGQRALLIERPGGMVMWDCIPLVTDEAVEFIRARGGLKAIAISHPHFYGAMASWSEAFGDVPIYLHEADRDWVTRPHCSIVHWSGERRAIDESLTLVRCGGHFPGAMMLHASDGEGALHAGDVAMVAFDRRHVSFMFSYPNYIPLNATAVEGIARAVDGLAFDRIYSAWWDRNVVGDARAAFDGSVERYLAAIADTPS